MDLIGGYADGIQQCLAHHPIVTVGMIRGDAAFVHPEDVNSMPIKPAGRKLLEHEPRRRPTRDRQGYLFAALERLPEPIESESNRRRSGPFLVFRNVKVGPHATRSEMRVAVSRAAWKTVSEAKIFSSSLSRATSLLGGNQTRLLTPGLSSVESCKSR